MILVNLKSITYFRYIILTKEQTTLRNCRNNYSGDIIKLKFLTDKVIVHEVQNLYGSIVELIRQAKTRVALAINSEITLLYWHIGKHIH